MKMTIISVHFVLVVFADFYNRIWLLISSLWSPIPGLEVDCLEGDYRNKRKSLKWIIIVIIL